MVWLEAFCLSILCHKNTEKQLIYWVLGSSYSQVLNVFLKSQRMEIFSSGVSSHDLPLKGVHAYCNLLCLTALASQGERGIMGACEHYTVIGCRSHMGAGLWCAHGSLQCEPGLINPTQEQPFLGCSISCLFGFNPLFPPAKKKKNGCFSCTFFCFWDEFYFLWRVLPFDFIFKSIVFGHWRKRFSTKKIMWKKKRRKKTEWAQDQSFQNKIDVFSKTCFSKCLLCVYEAYITMNSR